MTHHIGNELIDRTAAAIDAQTAQAAGAAKRGMAAVRDGSQQMLDRVHGVSDRAAGYVQAEPVKSLLVAAAAGAVLMGLLSLLARTRERA